MYILGISAFYHDAAICLLKDGIPIFAAHEERFTRIKHDASFPTKALQACFRQENISIADIEHIVFYEKPFLKFERLLDTYSRISPKGFWSFRNAMKSWLSKKLWISDTIKKETGFKREILFTEHHEAHAASAYYASPFNEAVIVTLDGVGEKATGSIAIGKNNTLTLIEEQFFPHSIGLFYSAITYYCGFKVNSGEYKLMGYAPYGSPKYVHLMKKHFITINENGSVYLDQKYFNYQGGMKMIKPAFEKILGKKRRLPEQDNTQFYKDVAASAQEIVEEVILKTVQYAIAKTNIKNVCLAGGVALNCKANGMLLQQKIADAIWIQPASGDSGGALGAAYTIWHQHLGNSKKKLLDSPTSHAYLGTHYTHAEIKQVLLEYSLSFHVLSDKELITLLAQKLVNKEVVGWFQGKMEFGPRALGNRSILALPTFSDMKSYLNQKIKKREGFRPFAPIVMEDKANKWFQKIDTSKYMLFTYQSDCKEHIPSCIHEDNSARVQTISIEDNSLLYRVLNEVNTLTGVPLLINTSFNVRGEPIVESPLDAIKCFFQTDMDTLCIGNFIIEKSNQTTIHKDLLTQHLFELD